MAPPSRLSEIQKILEELDKKHSPEVAFFVETVVNQNEPLEKLLAQKPILVVPTVPFKNRERLRELARLLRQPKFSEIEAEAQADWRRLYAVALILDKALEAGRQEVEKAADKKEQAKRLRSFRATVGELLVAVFGPTFGNQIRALFHAETVSFKDLVCSRLFGLDIGRDRQELNEILERLGKFEEELGRGEFAALVRAVGMGEVLRIRRAAVRKLAEIRKGPLVRHLPAELLTPGTLEALGRLGWDAREVTRVIAYQGRIHLAKSAQATFDKDVVTKAVTNLAILLALNEDHEAAKMVLSKKSDFTLADAESALQRIQAYFGAYQAALGTEKPPAWAGGDEALQRLWKTEQRYLSIFQKDIDDSRRRLEEAVSQGKVVLFTDEAVAADIKQTLNQLLAKVHYKFRNLTAEAKMILSGAVKPEDANVESLWVEVSRPPGTESPFTVYQQPVRFLNNLDDDQNLATSPAAHLLRRFLLETRPVETNRRILLSSASTATVTQFVYWPPVGREPLVKVDLHMALTDLEKDGMVKVDGQFLYGLPLDRQLVETEIALLVKLLEAVGFEPIRLEPLYQDRNSSAYTTDASADISKDSQGRPKILGVRLQATYDKLAGAMSVSDLADKAQILLRASDLLSDNAFGIAVHEHLRVKTDTGLERVKQDPAIQQGVRYLLTGSDLDLNRVRSREVLPKAAEIEASDGPHLAGVLNGALGRLGLPLLPPTSEALSQDALDASTQAVEAGVKSERFVVQQEGLVQNPRFLSQPVRDFAWWLGRVGMWERMRETARLLNRLIAPDPSGNPHTALTFEPIGAIGGYLVLRTQVRTIGGPVTFYGLRRPHGDSFEMAYVVHGEEAYRLRRPSASKETHPHNRLENMEALEHRLKAFQIRMAEDAALPKEAPALEWKPEVRVVLKSREPPSLETLGVGLYAFPALPISAGRGVVTGPVAFNLPDETEVLDFEEKPGVHTLEVGGGRVFVSRTTDGKIAVGSPGQEVFKEEVSEKEALVSLGDRWLVIKRIEGERYVLSIWSYDPAAFKGKVMVSGHLAAGDIGKMHEAAAAVTTRGNVLGHAEIDARNAGLAVIVTGTENARLVHTAGGKPYLELAVNRYEWRDDQRKDLPVRFAKRRSSEVVRVYNGDLVTVDGQRGLLHVLPKEEKEKMGTVLDVMSNIQNTQKWLVLIHMLKTMQEPGVAQLILHEAFLARALPVEMRDNIFELMSKNKKAAPAARAYLGRIERILRGELEDLLDRTPEHLEALRPLGDLEGLGWIAREVNQKIRVYTDVARKLGALPRPLRDRVAIVHNALEMTLERFRVEVGTINSRTSWRKEDLSAEDLPLLERAMDAVPVLGLPAEDFEALAGAREEIERRLQLEVAKDTQRRIWWLNQARRWHSGFVGPKFANLGELRHHRLPVPPAFALRGYLKELSQARAEAQNEPSDPWRDLRSRLIQIYEEARNEGRPEEEIRKKLREEVSRRRDALRDWIQKAPWPADLRQELVEAYHALIGFDAFKRDVSALLLADGVLQEMADQIRMIPTVEEYLEFWQRGVRSDMSPETVQKVLDKIQDLPAVIIRSSSVMEDRKEMAAAGQFLSKPGYRGEERLLDAIKDVMLSMFNENVIDNFTGKQLAEYPELAFCPTAIVQVLVDSKKAGVLNTVNNVEGDWRQMVINAGWGQGEAVVGGQQNADRFVVSLKNRVFYEARSYIGTKLQKMVLAKDGSGLVRQETELSERNAPVLSSEEIKQLTVLGGRIADIFLSPQDIEWAIGPDGKIFITQSRPIAEIRISTPLPLELLKLLPPEGEADPDTDGHEERGNDA